MATVAICGSQGSGKSTILRALGEIGYNTIEGKVARSILEEWGQTLSDVYKDTYSTQDFQETILDYKQSDEEPFNEPRTGYTFVERTYADLFSYALLNLGRLNEYNIWLDQYHQECKEAQQAYSLIFYLPANVFLIEDDGVRSINNHYGNSVDLILLHYLKEMSSCPVITLDCPSVEERVITITNTIAMLEL